MKSIGIHLSLLVFLLNINGIFALAQVTATIDGVVVENFKGAIKNGILSFYTGEDVTWEYGQKVSFWHMPDTLNEKEIDYPSSDGHSQSGQMTYSNKDPKVNLSTVWLKKFKYKIKFGTEKDFKIPVVFEGEALEPHNIRIKGKLKIATAGIKMSNGVIDPSFDHLDTITWLLKDWVKKSYKIKKFLGRVDTCSMEMLGKREKKGYRQVASCSILFFDQGGRVRISKLWFEKKDNKWRAVAALKSSQLLTAHPIKPPLRNKPPYIFDKTAAEKFEKEIYPRLGGYIRVVEPSHWTCGGGQAEGQKGYCEAQYKVYEKSRTGDDADKYRFEFVTYLFDKETDGKWKITKELKSNQKYNSRKKKIEIRKSRF